MWVYCKSCLNWLDLPDDISVQVLKGGKGLVVYDGKTHTVLIGRHLEKMKIKNPPPKEESNG